MVGLLRRMGSVVLAVAGLVAAVLAVLAWVLHGLESVLHRRRSTRWFVLPFYRRATRRLKKRVAAGLEIHAALQRRDVEALLRRKLIGRLVLVPAYRAVGRRWTGSRG